MLTASLITLLQLLVASTSISILGYSACKTLGIKPINSFQIGFAIFLSVGFMVYKLGFHELAGPTFLLFILVALLFIFYPRKNHLDFAAVWRDYLGTLSLILISLFIVVIPQIALSQLGETATSFDTTAGDMYSYLEVSESLRNVGWLGSPNVNIHDSFLDVASSNLGDYYEHMGAGGYVLLASFSSIFMQPTWIVGMAALLTSWIFVIKSSISFLTHFTKFESKKIYIFSLLIFASVPFLNVIGWWALNQMIFMGLLFIALVYPTIRSSTGFKFTWPLLLGVITILAFETYPSTAIYSVVPLLIYFFLTDAISLVRKGELRRHALELLGYLLPLAYSLLGTLQFLPRVLESQLGHQLDLGSPAPSLFDFLGLRPFSELLHLEFVAALGNPVFWVVILLALIIRNIVTQRLPLTQLNLHLLFVILGASLLIIFTTLNGDADYQDYKIRMIWIPFLLISLIALMGSRAHGFKVQPGKNILVVIPSVLVLANIGAYGIYMTWNLADNRGIQLHTISKEKIDVRGHISNEISPALVTDFSSGTGWTPWDRAIAGVLSKYPGPRILSGSLWSGPEIYTGVVVTFANNELGPHIDNAHEIYSNSVYSIKHICRVMCANPEDKITAFAIGINRNQSENEFVDTNFAETNIDRGLYVYSAQSRELTFTFTFEGEICSTVTTTAFEEPGRFTKVEMPFPSSCDNKIEKISIESSP